MAESRYKYLYERLGDHSFQNLVSALLAHQFSDYQAFPLRQSDGGRDGLHSYNGEEIVYQVKWSVAGKDKNPVTSLSSAVEKELENIEELVKRGATKYVLVTNTPGTGKRDSGSIDNLETELDKYRQMLGIEVSCIWRETLDAWVDGADKDLKWTYADMLAGWDLIRYLVSDDAKVARDQKLRNLLSKVASAQWREDGLIKFSQVDVDREQLHDLFVDVDAERISPPTRRTEMKLEKGGLGGAARYLIEGKYYPYTLVLGAPGQGKSTLTQYVCQAFRVSFIQKTPDVELFPAPKAPRFPLRVDLSDYSAWRQGEDIFNESLDSSSKKKTKKIPSAEATIESFLGDFITYNSGGIAVSSREVQEILERVPTLLVMDGLDEVGSKAERKRVVQEINQFCARGKSYAVLPQVVVTARPNSAGLSEPDPSLFEVISLALLSPRQRDQYLRKWCGVYDVRGEDARRLSRNFTAKTRERHVNELAGNPMQLTILLQLLRHHGDATPTQRTELYDAYMDMLFAREANKLPDSVRKYRADLADIVPFLGWYLQSRAEEHGHSGRMTIANLKAAMKHFQTTYGKRDTVVDQLFEAATDRLWALTSKDQGTFEFEVQSLREYFAAKFLYESAGEDNRHFDKVVVFRELLSRPYWFNTVRFYGGNAIGSDIHILKEGLIQEAGEPNSKQSRIAGWTLVTDGVFDTRPYHAQDVVKALLSGTGSSVLLAALDRKEIVPLTEKSHGDRSWEHITGVIKADPASPANFAHIRVAQSLLSRAGALGEWWVDRYAEAVQSSSSEMDWLRLGAAYQVAKGQSLAIDGIPESEGERVQLLLNTGVHPVASSEGSFLAHILDGQCSETTTAESKLAQIAVALSPAEFYRFGSDSKITQPKQASNNLRSQSIQRLSKSDPSYAAIANTRRFDKGQKGTTDPWANTALALVKHAGRCWLATEIAIIGAASPLNNGFPIIPGAVPFGPEANPATLILETRQNRKNQQWWANQLQHCVDDLSRAEWALALWAVASAEVIEGLLGAWEQVVTDLPHNRQRVLLVAAERLGYAGFLRSRMVCVTGRGGITKKLLSLRAPAKRVEETVPTLADAAEEPLAAVARAGEWFLVDSAGRYH